MSSPADNNNNQATAQVPSSIPAPATQMGSPVQGVPEIPGSVPQVGVPQVGATVGAPVGAVPQIVYPANQSISYYVPQNPNVSYYSLQSPIMQAPVMQAPIMQAPVMQAPMMQTPILQQPGTAIVIQQPQQQPQQQQQLPSNQNEKVNNNNNNNNNNATTTVYMLSQNSTVPRNSICTVCPLCKKTVYTVVKYEENAIVWIACLILFCLTIIFFFIPLLIESIKDAVHYCPNCGHEIARNEKKL